MPVHRSSGNTENEVTHTKKWKTLWLLFADFLQMGLYTFGGGWSLVAQIQQRYVEKKNILTAEELLDLVSVGKSIPGMMITNVAMLFGYRVAGLIGGVVCILGMCLPPLVILMGIRVCYAAFRDNYWINAAMLGMQAAVVPIIGAAAKNLVKGSLSYPPCVLVVLASTLLYVLTDIPPVFLVVMGAVSGLVITGFYEKRGLTQNGVD